MDSSAAPQIRPFADADLDAVARIHAAAFPRQRRSAEWVACKARAQPLVRIYVAAFHGGIGGYAIWAEKSGFRDRAVVELEQVAVDAERRRKGVGTALIRASLADLGARLADRGARLGAVVVTTRADNAAQSLYRRILGAEVEATIAGLFSADEVVMVARDPLRACGADGPAAAPEKL